MSLFLIFVLFIEKRNVWMKYPYITIFQKSLVDQNKLFGFHIDALNVQCTVDGTTVNVVNIEYSP